MNKLFFFKDLDDHYVLNIAGISLSIKHKSRFQYKKALEYGLETNKRCPQLIVCLTTHPARINYVHYAINTLLRQNLKPDKVILWLAREQFPKGEGELPQQLLHLKDLGLSIEWCEDLKSYKKLVPALLMYPNDIIVTADDDVYYEEDVLKSLYNAYQNNTNNIYVRRSVRLNFENGNIKYISSRRYFYKHILEPSYFNQLMGGSACLYPPHSLYKDVVNIEQIQKLIPTHDDVYFWAMAVLNKTKIQVVKGFEANLYFVQEAQDTGLIHLNQSGQTGIALEDAYKVMIKEYPEILKILKSEI